MIMRAPHLLAAAFLLAPLTGDTSHGGSLKDDEVKLGYLSSRHLTECGCAGLKEEETNPQEDAAHNEALQTSSHASKNTAVWRLLDGPGATPEVAARTPVANRTAAGRLDFVLQVRVWLMHHKAELQHLASRISVMRVLCCTVIICPVDTKCNRHQSN
jgi:hypothetical protein